MPYAPSNPRQLAALYRFLAPLVAAGVLFSGLTLTLFTGHPVGGWLTITAFVLASLLIGYPRRLLALFVAVVILQHVLQSLHSHWLLQLSDKLTALLLLGVVIVNFIKHRGERDDLRRFNWALALFMGLALAGALINRVSPIQALRFFLTYGSFIPAFYMAYHFLRPNEADARRVMLAIFAIFGLQVILNLGWLAGINPLPNHSAGTEDFAIGSLGLCNVVAYLTVAVIFLLFAIFHRFPDLKVKLLVAVGGLIATVQLVFTFTFHAFPPMAALLFVQMVYGIKAMRYKLAMACLVLLFIGSYYYIKADPRLSQAFGFPAEDVMTVSEFRLRWDRMWRGGKGQAYYNIFVRARDDMPVWLLGAGPGNFASGIGMVHRSMLAEKYVNYIYLTYSGRREMYGGSITQHITTGVNAIYSEFGPLGLLLFYGLHGLAVVRILRLYRAGAYRSPIRQALAEAFIPTMLLYLGLNLISDFHSDTFLQVGVWLWAGAVWKPDAAAPPPEARTEETASAPVASPPLATVPRNATWRQA